MRIIFARHGNTFAPGDRVVWVGSGDDPPLVEKGREQARLLAEALAAGGVKPAAVFCAPLRRTLEYAEIVAEALGLDAAPAADQRLIEIDYGEWAGKTSAEIAERPGLEAKMAAWSEDDVWPREAGWSGSEAVVREAAWNFMKEVTEEHGDDDILLAVSSNGILRFFPRVVSLSPSAAAQRKSFRMKTGHAGVMDCRGGCFLLPCWNVPPDAIVL